MKNFAFYILAFLFVTGCDDIVDSKPGDPIEPVTNLEYSITDNNEVNLSWDLPADFPEDIIQPVSVSIKISVASNENGRLTYEETNAVVVEDAPESYIDSVYYDPESSYEYRYTVKVRGEVDTTDPSISDLRYSLGETVSIN